MVWYVIILGHVPLEFAKVKTVLNVKFGRRSILV